MGEQMSSFSNKGLQHRRVKARTRLQYEAAECGAASLATILAYFGCFVELRELRQACGVNRDGSNAKQILQAARIYGLEARAYRCSGEELKQDGLFPCIVFWGFNHYLVVEGFSATHAYVSDPAQGRTRMETEEFLDNFTGIVLELKPGAEFKIGGAERSPLLAIPATLWPYRGALIQLLLLAIGQALTTLMVAGLTSTFIDGFLQNQRLYFGVPILWILLIAVTGWLVILSLEFIIMRRIELLLSKRLTADLFKKLFKVTFSFYQARFQGELAGRMLVGLETTQVVVAQLLRFCVNLFVALLVLGFACVISWWLALLVFTFMAANLLLNWWLTDQRYDANRRLAIEQGKAQGKGLQGINNIEALKASGLEFDFLSQWQSSFSNVVFQNQQLGSQMAISTISSSGSTFLLNALIITIGGLLIISGKLSLGTLVAFQFVQSQLMAPISTLPQINSSIQRLIGNLGRLEDLKTTEDDPLVKSFSTNTASANIDRDPDKRLVGSLELKRLNFSFDPVSPAFINDLDLTVPAGSQLAIVGGSGSGKTTLIRIIAGLYKQSSGKLLFDGVPWEEHGDRVIRDSLAYVPQQVFVFNSTIRENITLWRPGYSLGQLEIAARDAQLLDTITAHPEAFERKLRDNGSDLSGGERQRLEICRALLRRPSILLLDEATSALDNVTQTRILDVLKKRGITVISVAHRLDAALRSDQVLVMNGGQVVERGSPDELLAQNGSFSALVQSEKNVQEALQ